jgi:hypothetical protein
MSDPLRDLDEALAGCSANATMQALSAKLGGARGIADEYHKIFVHSETSNGTRLKILDSVTKNLIKLEGQTMQAGVPKSVLVLIKAVLPQLADDSPLKPQFRALALALGDQPDV